MEKNLKYEIINYDIWNMIVYLLIRRKKLKLSLKSVKIVKRILDFFYRK